MSDGSVFVRWYGSVLEGSVEDNTTKDGPLAGMVAVRIPLMGMYPVALFCPQHVYETEAQAAEGIRQQPVKRDVPVPPAMEHTADAVVKPVSDAWSQLQQFKRAHWDEQRNHLQTDALDEFYQMWREGVRQRRATKQTTGQGATEMIATTSSQGGVPLAQRRKKPVIVQLSLF